MAPTTTLAEDMSLCDLSNDGEVVDEGEKLLTENLSCESVKM